MAVRARTAPPASPQPQARARALSVRGVWAPGAVVAFGLVLGLSFGASACGGSASETPFPQSPDEISVYPTLHKPGTPRRKAPGAGSAAASASPTPTLLVPEED